MAVKLTRGTRLSEINVTPLVDVMLVLLVIFMVTAPLLQQGVNVDLPKVAAESSDVSDDAIVITVDKNRQLFINDHTVLLPDLRTKLTEIFKQRQRKEVFLRADRDVPYGRVVETMAVIRASGINRLNMVTDPLEASSPNGKGPVKRR